MICHFLETDIPVLLFEDDGSLVYSPASKIKYQCSVMERRIKDMKEKRENVSPTGMMINVVFHLQDAELHFLFIARFLSVLVPFVNIPLPHPHILVGEQAVKMKLNLYIFHEEMHLIFPLRLILVSCFSHYLNNYK